jgi:hypothetical protein
MITTGSKLLIGATVLATLSAIAYGVTTNDDMGTLGLASAAVALAFLTTMNMYLRDSNVAADTESVRTVGAALVAPVRSVWPFVFAFGAVTIVVGLISYQAIFIIGVVALLAAGAQWTVQAWSEGASADRTYNAEVRSRISNTLEFPLLGAIGVGIVVYAFSRIMLWLSKTNTVVAFAVVAFLVLVVAFLFAYRPTIKTGGFVALSSLAVVGIVAGGAAAGIDGQREIHPHETVEELGLEGFCESPEEFEVDENASQTVAAKSNVAARITLTDAGELVATVPGSDGRFIAPITFPRSNPSNVIFINESSEARRLTLDLGPVEEGREEEQEEEQEEEESHVGRDQTCTTLVEDGGEQLLTITVGVPSIAVPDGYRFFVPGVASADLGLVVP